MSTIGVWRKHVENTKPAEETSIFLAPSWIKLPSERSYTKPSAGGSAMGSHCGPAPHPQYLTEVNMSASCSPFASGPTERKIRPCSLRLRSTRCLIYEWVLRQRSLLRVAAPSVKGTVTPSMRRRESRTERWLTAIRAFHARTCWGSEKPHSWCSLTASLEWRLAVEKVGHTSCLWKWVSTFYACAVNKEVSTLSSVATATWMRQCIYS